MSKAKSILTTVAAVLALSAGYLMFRAKEPTAVIYVEFIQKKVQMNANRGYVFLGEPLSDQSLISVIQEEGLVTKWDLDSNNEALEILRSKIRHESLRGDDVNVLSVDGMDNELGKRVLKRIVERWKQDLEDTSHSILTLRVLDSAPR